MLASRTGPHETDINVPGFDPIRSAMCLP